MKRIKQIALQYAVNNQYQAGSYKTLLSKAVTFGYEQAQKELKSENADNTDLGIKIAGHRRSPSEWAEWLNNLNEYDRDIE